MSHCVDLLGSGGSGSEPLLNFSLEIFKVNPLRICDLLLNNSPIDLGGDCLVGGRAGDLTGDSVLEHEAPDYAVN